MQRGARLPRISTTVLYFPQPEPALSPADNEDLGSPHMTRTVLCRRTAHHHQPTSTEYIGSSGSVAEGKLPRAGANWLDVARRGGGGGGRPLQGGRAR